MFYKKMAPAFYWALVILVLTLSPWMPSLPTGPWNFSGIDLVAHCVFFGIQSLLLCRGFDLQNVYPTYQKYYGSFSMTYTSIFGIFIEVLQYYHPTRYFEFFDMLADILGAILGFMAYLLLKRLQK